MIIIILYGLLGVFLSRTALSLDTLKTVDVSLAEASGRSRGIELFSGLSMKELFSQPGSPPEIHHNSLKVENPVASDLLSSLSFDGNFPL